MKYRKLRNMALAISILATLMILMGCGQNYKVGQCYQHKHSIWSNKTIIKIKRVKKHGVVANYKNEICNELKCEQTWAKAYITFKSLKEGYEQLDCVAFDKLIK